VQRNPAEHRHNKVLDFGIPIELESWLGERVRCWMEGRQ